MSPLSLDDRLALLDELGVPIAYVAQHVNKLRRQGKPVRVKTDLLVLERQGRKRHRANLAELDRFLTPAAKRTALDAIDATSADPVVVWVRVKRLVTQCRTAARANGYAGGGG